MTSQQLYDLIKKRHDGQAWIVVGEVGNNTGASVSRHADALAIGLWPSHGHALHGFEIKVSRADVQKELRDPSKADAVGKYCDHWWLVVADLAIIDGLVIPDTWGILAPKRGVLRVERKAPKRTATPITRGFMAAIIRKVCESWVPRDEHNAYKANAMEKAKAELERDRAWKQDSLNYEHDRLKAAVAKFEETSGIRISPENDGKGPGPSPWELGDIGAAVRAFVAAKRSQPRRANYELVEEMLKGELRTLERGAARHDQAAAELRGAVSWLVNQLKPLMEPVVAAEPTEVPVAEKTAWAQSIDDFIDETNAATRALVK